jgi:hypothetical protein
VSDDSERTPLEPEVSDDSERAPLLAAVAAASLALLGLVGVLLDDGPYLELASINPWIVLWAVGLFGLLAVAPFALHRLAAARTADRDRRWELAVVGWGGLALAAGIGFAAIAVATGFSSTGAVGALALVGLAECALVVGAVLTLMLTTG